MTEETSEENPMPLPDRGTASRGNPIVGTPYNDEEQSNRLVIRDPRGPVRVYELDEEIREHLEAPTNAALEEIADWHEIWWEGTTMHVEFQGHVRKPSAKPDVGQQPQGGEQKGLPRYPQPPFTGRRGVPQVNIDFDKLVAEKGIEVEAPKGFDKGLMPVHDFEQIDWQERANKQPLEFEDLFVLLDVDPIDEAAEDVQNAELDIEDFREMEDKNETLPEGARGNRYNL